MALPLPRGIYQTPIEPITSAQIIGPKRHWLIASPDGSIHFVGGEAGPLDMFHYGQALSGLGGLRRRRIALDRGDAEKRRGLEGRAEVA